MTKDFISGEDEPLRLPIRFVGSGSEYFRIWIVNLLLTLVTLGLYYPFAKVRKLRYFHGATEVAGHPLSFHADPWKMLRGYVLAAVMLGLYSVAGQVSATAGLIAFVILALLWPALWHSSLCFRLANTGWRGLRFRFTGSRGGAYRVMALPSIAAGLFLAMALWAEGMKPADGKAPVEAPSAWLAMLPLLMMLLLSAFLPWFTWLMRRYRHNHFALGAERTRFSLGFGAYYRVCFVGGLLMAVVAAVVGGAVAGVMFAVGAFAGVAGAAAGGDSSGAEGSGLPPGWGTMLVTLVSVGAVYASLFVVFAAYVGGRLQNLSWNATRSANLSFDSRVSARALARVLATNLVLTVLTLGLYWPFAAIAAARLRLQSVDVLARTDPDQLFSDSGRTDESAAGDAAGDLFGFDLGL